MNPILINIWAAWIGIEEHNKIKRLEKGIEKEYKDNNGKEKNKEKALESNLKFIKLQKHKKKIIKKLMKDFLN